MICPRKNSTLKFSSIVYGIFEVFNMCEFLGFTTGKRVIREEEKKYI